LRTTEATGESLNWLVAKSLGIALVWQGSGFTEFCKDPADEVDGYNPAGDIDQAQSVIEQAGIAVSFVDGEWQARQPDNSNLIVVGLNRSTAALRCLVVNSFGAEVSIPIEIEQFEQRVSSRRNQNAMKSPKFVFTERLIEPLCIHKFHDLTHVRFINADKKSRWGALGGMVLFEAADQNLIAPEFHAIRISFHSENNSWMMQEEEHCIDGKSYPHVNFGPLEALMSQFERETGLALPTVRLQDVGVGYSDVSSSGVSTDPVNPWQLQSGSFYEIVQTVNTWGDGPLIRQFEVSQDAVGDLQMVFLNDPNYGDETFKPHVIFTGEDWLNLRQVTEEATQNDHASSARSMRQSC
jgi:hypothetical protein